MHTRVACIGSRDLNPYQTAMCEKLGAWIVQCGHILDSGNAPGADQAYARGANQFRPDLVHLHLPWYNFERQAIHDDNVVHILDDLDQLHLDFYNKIAQKNHPAFHRLSQGAKKLMIRNSSIVFPPPMYFPVDMCLAIPSAKRGGGGTGQGMRIAQHESIKLVDLRGYLDPDLFLLCEDITKLEEIK